MHDPVDPTDVLDDELEQSRECRRELSHIERRARGVLLDVIRESPRRRDWPFVEIEAADDVARHAPTVPPQSIDEPPALTDRIHDASLGRCIDCLLGKPIDGWSAVEIEGYLSKAGASPADGCVPALEPHPRWASPFKPSWVEATRGRIDGVPRDDDLDYRLIGLITMAA